MKNTLLKIIIVAILGVTHLLSFSQLKLTTSSTVNYICNGDCKYEGPTILINEIQIAPMSGNGSIWENNCGEYGECGEWIELYNPHKCQAVDISYYFLGNHSKEDMDESYAGGLLIPSGTIIPPRGFCVIRGVNAPPLPADLLLENGGKAIEIVVDNNIVKTCIGEGKRLWFPDNGGWFAFYDRDGVPQDAVSWGITEHSCKSCSPCIPSGVYLPDKLSSYNQIPSDRKIQLDYGVLPISSSSDTYRRYKDGEIWVTQSLGGRGSATMGDCNFDCLPPPVVTCNGTATVSVNGGTPPYKYFWDDYKWQTTSTATGLCAGTYTVRVRDNTGQTAMTTVEVFNYRPPINIPSHLPVCIDAPVFEWEGITPDAGIFTGTGLSGVTFNPFIAGAGTHQLTYAYTDANECYNSTSTSMTVYPLPVLDSIPDFAFCDGEISSIIFFTGTHVDTTYWEVISGSGTGIGMNVNKGKDSIPAFQAVNNSIFTDTVKIKVTPKSATGCIGEPKTFTITVGLPELTSPKDLVFCAGDVVPAIVFTGSNMSSVDWFATPSGTAIGLSNDFGTGYIPTFLATNNRAVSDTVKITVIPKSSAGCEGEAKTFTIIINPLPMLDPVANIILCTGDAVPSIIFTGVNVISATWVATGPSAAIGMNTNNGTDSIEAFIAINNRNIPDTVIITVTPKSIGNCGKPRIFTIIVHPLPVLNLIKDITFCAGDTVSSIVFSGVSVANVTWVAIGSGTTIGMSTNVGTDFIQGFTATNTTAYPISIPFTATPKSVANCIGEPQMFTITVHPLPVLNQIKDLNSCIGDTVPTICFTGINIPVVTWISSGSATAIGLPANNGTGNIPSFIGSNTTVYPLSVTITATPKSVTDCIGKPQIFTITVNPLPVLNPISDITLCPGVTSSIISFSGSNVNTTTTAWDAPEGIAIGMPLSSGTGNIPAFKTINSDTTDISVTVDVTPKSAAGCVGKTETFTITVYHKVDIGVYLGNDTTICRGVRHLLDATHPEADSYEWYDQSKEAIYTVSNQEGKIWVIVRGQCNEFRDTINIRLYKNPTVNLGKDLTFCEDEVIYRVLDVTTPNATSYVWQDGSILPTYIVEQTGIYRVTVSNICVSVSDTVEVKVKDCSVLEIWLPNAFTPDGDGLNDVFQPAVKTPEFLKEYEMTIYDRWGKLMFITQDYLSGWRGKDHKNRDCSEGVYTGVIRYKNNENQEFIKKFSITLLR